MSAIELSVKLSNSKIKSPIVCTISTVMHFAAEGRSLIEIFKVIEIIWSQEIGFLLDFSWEEPVPEMDKGCNGTVDVVISINSKWTIWLRNMPIYSTTLITSIFSHKRLFSFYLVKILSTRSGVTKFMSMQFSVNTLCNSYCTTHIKNYKETWRVLIARFYHPLSLLWFSL